MDFEALLNKKSREIASILDITKNQAKKILMKLVLINREKRADISRILNEWEREVGKCKKCNALVLKNTKCPYEKENRNKRIICVVSSQEVLQKIENSGFYNGVYYVLNSEIDAKKDKVNNIGEEKLAALIKNNRASELIIATSPTFTGEMTAVFLTDKFKGLLKITRFGYGVSFGSNLSYVDSNTLKYAFKNRKERNND